MSESKHVPVAWIEHHKGGDNLNWDRVDHPYAKATPLYADAAPPPEQAAEPAPAKRVSSQCIAGCLMRAAHGPRAECDKDQCELEIASRPPYPEPAPAQELPPRDPKIGIDLCPTCLQSRHAASDRDKAERELAQARDDLKFEEDEAAHFQKQAEELRAKLAKVGAECADCGFRYEEHKGHIIACPVCALAKFAKAGEGMPPPVIVTTSPPNWNGNVFRDVSESDYNLLRTWAIAQAARVSELESQRGTLAATEKGFTPLGNIIANLEKELSAAQSRCEQMGKILERCKEFIVDVQFDTMKYGGKGLIAEIDAARKQEKPA